MGNPQPPVGGIFRPDGLFLTLVEGDSLTHRLLTWNDLEKLARRGKKQKATGMLRDFTKKVDDMIVDSEKRSQESKARLKELQALAVPPRAAP